MRPAKGEILLRGEPIHALGAEKIARLGVGHAPEGRRLFGRMTVRENLDMGAYSRSDRAGIRADFERVYQLFPRIKERSGQLAGSLSGGEQQMVAIGRALMAHPSVLLLDEPSLGLAPIIVDALFAVIREINQGGTTVLLIEQNALLALNTARRGYVLEVGEVATQGPADAAAPLARRAARVPGNVTDRTGRPFVAPWRPTVDHAEGQRCSSAGRPSQQTQHTQHRGNSRASSTPTG